MAVFWADDRAVPERSVQRTWTDFVSVALALWCEVLGQRVLGTQERSTHHAEAM